MDLTKLDKLQCPSKDFQFELNWNEEQYKDNKENLKHLYNDIQGFYESIWHFKSENLTKVDRNHLFPVPDYNFFFLAKYTLTKLNWST